MLIKTYALNFHSHAGLFVCSHFPHKISFSSLYNTDNRLSIIDFFIVDFQVDICKTK